MMANNLPLAFLKFKYQGVTGPYALPAAGVWLKAKHGLGL
jgi:hypothetical protein